MSKIVDPDGLVRGGNIVFDTDNKTIQLIESGTLNDTPPGRSSGVTEQAVYSKCKELWKTESDLNKLKFPFTAITEVKMDLINTWNWADAQTKQLIRDGGWAVRSGSTNVLIDSYMGIVSLGNFVTSSDQAYYQQTGSGQSINFDKNGELNEAIFIYSASNFDYRGYFKAFLRIFEKQFVESDLVTEQQVPVLDYTVYKLPLANAADIKITHSDYSASAEPPYTTMTLDYLSGSWYNTYVSADTYPRWTVVNSGSRWYRVSGSVTSTSGIDPLSSSLSSPNGDWETYPGEREIGNGLYYAFDRIVSGSGATLEQFYEWMQYELRHSGSINDDVNGDGMGYITGSTADLLAAFLGDTLQTKAGVYIDNFLTADTNRVEFFDITANFSGSTSTKRTFPFVATGQIIFNNTLFNDTDAIFKVYFTNDNAPGFALGYNYDTVNAIIVSESDGGELTGSIPGDGVVNFSYDYDFNDQRGFGSTGSDAPITVAALGLSGAQWISAGFTISRASGLSFPVNAADERNYSNPAGS